jgi:co-chaperonin GroES (HSP10)
MKHSYSKLILAFTVIMVVGLLYGTKASAGVVVEEYNAKLHKATGVITKIQGKMLTLRTDKGDIIKIGVRGESQEDKNILRRFKVGDRLIIDNGKVRADLPEPLPRPSQKGNLPEPMPRPIR